MTRLPSPPSSTTPSVECRGPQVSWWSHSPRQQGCQGCFNNIILVLSLMSDNWRLERCLVSRHHPIPPPLSLPNLSSPFTLHHSLWETFLASTDTSPDRRQQKDPPCVCPWQNCNKSEKKLKIPSDSVFLFKAKARQNPLSRYRLSSLCI